MTPTLIKVICGCILSVIPICIIMVGVALWVEKKEEEDGR